MDVGKLLYETPHTTHKAQMKRTYQYVGPLVFAAALVIPSFTWLFYTILKIRNIYDAFVLLFIISIPIILILNRLRYVVTSKFVVFENGFHSPIRPINYIFKRRGFFVSYSEIVAIDFYALAHCCTVTLKSGKEITLWVHYGSDGYVLVCSKLAEKLLPENKRPDLEIVKESYEMEKKLERKEVSKKEADKIFKLEKERNKDYDYM